jgi:hypothetical protein
MDIREWVIRIAVVVLCAGALWTVFGSDALELITGAPAVAGSPRP